MTFMKLDSAFEIDSPKKQTNKSNAIVKKLYEDWKHSNKCYMMMMDNYMDGEFLRWIHQRDFLRR